MKYIIPNWSSLTKLGESKLVKMTMFIPIFGYLILFNENVIHFFSPTLEISNLNSSLVENVDGKTKLYYIYFGLTFLGLATFLYQVTCPNLIKQYSSVRGYIKENVEFMTQNRVLSLSKHITERYEPHLITNKAISFIDNKNFDISSQTDSDNLRHFAIDILQHFWNLNTWSNCLLRSMVLILFLIGFLCLLIPSVEMFFKIAILFYS